MTADRGPWTTPPPSVVDAPARLVGFADVHGDLDATLRVEMRILDANDNAPTLNGNEDYFAGILVDSSGEWSDFIEADDVDPSDAEAGPLTYAIEGNVTVSEGNVGLDGITVEPFVIDPKGSDGFDLKSVFTITTDMKGFFEFKLSCTDNAGQEISF